MIDWTRVKREWGKLKPSDFWILPLTFFVGPWYPLLVVKYRGWARNYVYNYILQNNRRDLLARLWQRNYGLGSETFWCSIPGYIRTRKTNTFIFWLVVFFIYGWCDDDANEDTTDIGYCNSLKGIKVRTDQDRSQDLAGRLFGRFLPAFKEGGVFFGNAFNLGDIRAEHGYFSFWPFFVWNLRNTGMNFKYLFQNY